MSWGNCLQHAMSNANSRLEQEVDSQRELALKRQRELASSMMNSWGRWDIVASTLPPSMSRPVARAFKDYEIDDNLTVRQELQRDTDKWLEGIKL